MSRSRLPEGLDDELVTTRTAAQIAEAVAGGLTAERAPLDDDGTPGILGATLGSSNLSATALTEGREWNVRLSEIESPAVLEKFQSTFEAYWESPDFDPYTPAADGARFEAAIKRARGEGRDAPDDSPSSGSTSPHTPSRKRSSVELRGRRRPPLDSGYELR